MIIIIMTFIMMMMINPIYKLHRFEDALNAIVPVYQEYNEGVEEMKENLRKPYEVQALTAEEREKKLKAEQEEGEVTGADGDKDSVKSSEESGEEVENWDEAEAALEEKQPAGKAKSDAVCAICSTCHCSTLTHIRGRRTMNVSRLRLLRRQSRNLQA